MKTFRVMKGREQVFMMHLEDLDALQLRKMIQDLATMETIATRRPSTGQRAIRNAIAFYWNHLSNATEREDDEAV